ncbi:MAG: aminotransferase class V-fold PLP-dependent enzyme [Bacillota bacterium]
MNDYSDWVVGADSRVPLLDGRTVRYVNLDNAASTPPLRDVAETLDRLMPWYSSVHRGAGYKSRLTTQAFEAARRKVGSFLRADPQQDVVVFVRNATEALNRLARRLPAQGRRDVVITSRMEHHSNDLPWRAGGRAVHVEVDRDGRLDMADLRAKLAQYRDTVRLVAVTGASNVTGFINPIHDIARLAHEAGALMAVDAAQLAPHRAVDMRPHGDPEHLDFVIIAAHKMYAPYGSGALVGPRQVFEQTPPADVGGGTVSLVGDRQVEWAHAPDREEAGSPNVPGAVALGKAVEVLGALGMDRVAEHEADLVRYALPRLARIPRLRLYGCSDPGRVEERVGVISFDLEGLHHALVAAVLAYEAGVGVRNGCFCAHPYVTRLKRVGPREFERIRRQVSRGDRTHAPGMVRASFGLYNTTEDVDVLVEALGRVARGDIRGDYVFDPAGPSYEPRGFSWDLERALEPGRDLIGPR